MLIGSSGKLKEDNEGDLEICIFFGVIFDDRDFKYNIGKFRLSCMFF